MSTATLFDRQYERRKADLLGEVVERLRGRYTPEETAALRIDPVDPEILSQRSGRGFVNRDILETVLGNLLECVAPGSHNAVAPQAKQGLSSALGEVADQVYAMVAQSLLAAGEEERLEEGALAATFALLWELPGLKERSRWNRFASLKDPAVWDAYLLHTCGLSPGELAGLDFGRHLDRAIAERDFGLYREFLKSLKCDFIFDYQMQLVMSTYPGWRVLFYHDVAHSLTRSGEVAGNPQLTRLPVPLLPRAISELAGRYYQADIHPETEIGDAIFFDHPHRGITTGQTGVIGSGCHLMPCTLGGLSRRLRRRHPRLGEGVFIGTDANLIGPVIIGDRSVIGANTEVYGFVEVGRDCRIGSSVVVGTVKSTDASPGRVLVGDGVRIGDGTIVENESPQDLEIPGGTQIQARSHVVNRGGAPEYIG